MNYIFLIVAFILLTPGILVTLPPRGTRIQVALVHALLFGGIYMLFKSYRADGFQDAAPYQCCDADSVCLPHPLCSGEHEGKTCPGPEDKPARKCTKMPA
jgi:hypothetical protein